MSLMSEYLRPYAHLDGIEEIVKEMTAAARRIPATPEGLLEMLAHPAAFEEAAFEHLLVYPELLERVAERHDLAPTLVAWTAKQEGGRAQRGLYALVRILGGESVHAHLGLQSGHGPSEIAVLCALSDPKSDGSQPDEPIGAVAADAIRRLIRQGVSEGGGESSDRMRPLDEDPRFAARPLVVCGLRLSDADALREMLANTWLREQVIELLAQGPGPSGVAAALNDSLQADVEAIRAGGRKATNAMSRVAGSVSAISNDKTAGNLVASVFPVFVEHYGPLYRPHPDGHEQTATKRELDAVLAFLSRAMPDLEEPGLRHVAAVLEHEFVPAFDVAAEAWARLPMDAAEVLARCFQRGVSEIRGARLNAAGRAIARQSDPNPGLGPILLKYVDAKVLSQDLRKALARFPADTGHLEEMISKARNQDELRTALQSAADLKAHGVLRAALVKLRGGPFRIDAAMERAISTLIHDDNEMWVEAEIEGENPFADRRAALKRALENKDRSPYELYPGW
jgi:hypothetical protein